MELNIVLFILPIPFVFLVLSPTLNVTSKTTNITVKMSFFGLKGGKAWQYCVSLNAIPVIGRNWTLAFNTKSICGDKEVQTFSGLEEFTTYLVTSWITDINGVGSVNTTMNISTETSSEFYLFIKLLCPALQLTKKLLRLNTLKSC